jgi:hypothetical protein
VHSTAFCVAGGLFTFHSKLLKDLGKKYLWDPFDLPLMDIE